MALEDLETLAFKQIATLKSYSKSEEFIRGHITGLFKCYSTIAKELHMIYDKHAYAELMFELLDNI